MADERKLRGSPSINKEYYYYYYYIIELLYHVYLATCTIMAIYRQIEEYGIVRVFIDRLVWPSGYKYI